MKRIVLLAPFLLLFSCSQDDDPPSPGPGNDPGNASGKFWIPNWAKDTMVGLRANVQTEADTPLYDVIYSDMSGDTSLLYYDGVKYYLWQEPLNNTFVVDANVYSLIVISKYPFTNDPDKVLTTGLGAMPHKYYDIDYGTWHDQEQVLMIDLKPPFPQWVNAGHYSTEYKWMIG